MPSHFTAAEDGLIQPWSGSVFVNPPYGRQISKWVAKAALEISRCRMIVMLLPARTDTGWFHDYVYGRAEVRFIRGRLKFSGSIWPAPFPSMVVIFRGVPS